MSNEKKPNLLDASEYTPLENVEIHMISHLKKSNFRELLSKKKNMKRTIATFSNKIGKTPGDVFVFIMHLLCQLNDMYHLPKRQKYAFNKKAFVLVGILLFILITVPIFVFLII